MRTADVADLELVLRDQLTGLPNRILLLDRIATAIAQAERDQTLSAVVVIDIARGKEIAATVGLEASEELIRLVADHLQLFVRRADTLASLGGDLFAILMPRVADIGQILALMKRTLRLFDGYWEIAGSSVLLTPGIGIACYPDDGSDAQALLGRALNVAYEATTKGLGTPLLADPHLQAAARARLALEADLLRAIQRDEFTLFYQPQVSVKSGAIAGVEALLRWQHPERGLLAPDEFVPLAEETRLIVPLGEAVIERACRQIADWRRAGLPSVRMAINLAAPQLADHALLDVVGTAIAKHHVRAGELELETTERVAYVDTKLSASVLAQLKELGTRITLDDFGTGYSSPLLLVQFPFDTLKIDRSFVASVLTGEKERAVTATIIDLAHRIGLTVVAEGVETKAQLALIKELGADEIQGYLFAKPLPAADVGKLMGGNTFASLMAGAD